MTTAEKIERTVKLYRLSAFRYESAEQFQARVLRTRQDLAANKRFARAVHKAALGGSHVCPLCKGEGWCRHCSKGTVTWGLEYARCPECQAVLSSTRTYWALRKFEKTHCSSKCYQAEWNRRHHCCEKAEPVGCVCAYAYSCPEHGTHHVGTHD